MRVNRIALGWLVAGLGATAFVNSGCRRAVAAEPTHPGDGGPVTLTIYKDDFGMVSEQRSVDLTAGTNHLRLGNISRSLDPDSVTFDAPRGSRVVATTYDLGLSSGQSLMQRLSGKEVELIWSSTDGRQGERIKGVLEPAADGGYLLRSGDKVYINPTGTLVAPADSDVATLPGLSVQVQSDSGGHDQLGMSYLTRGLSWSADYVAHLDPDAERLDLECWAGVTNRTGIPYHDAQISFVAGSPNRAAREPQSQAYAAAGEAKANDDLLERNRSNMSVLIQPTGELYQYKAKDPASIGVDQISRVRMFDATSVPVRLDYNVRLPDLYAWEISNRPARINAQLSIGFDNRSASGLGMPMPSGAVRIYQRDGKEDRYTGADTLVDIPVDQHAYLTLTKVFDVTAEPTVVSSKRVDKHTVRKSLRVLLRNSKSRDVEVRLVQGLAGRWKVVTGSVAERLSDGMAQWRVRVPASGSAVLESTLDVSM